MKNTLKTILAAIFLAAVGGAPLCAQTNLETSTTNATVTNAVAPVTAGNFQNTQSPSVRVDAPSFHFNGEDVKQSLAVMIPIIAIVMGCSIPIVIVGLQLYFRHRKNMVLHETLRTMEKGVPIPPEMFQKTEHEPMAGGQTRCPRNDFRKGLLMTGIGIGMILFIGKPGWIVLFLGIAFLAASFFEKKNNNDGQPPKQ
jgi:hypothetical protein